MENEVAFGITILWNEDGTYNIKHTGVADEIDLIGKLELVKSALCNKVIREKLYVKKN